MFNAAKEYILELEFNTSDFTTRNTFDIKRNVDNAIRQVSLEVRIPILIVLFFLKIAWLILTLLVFWIPRTVLYEKYRATIRRIPIASSVLILYETIIFMIYFES